jgi:hypothetical protein
VLWIGILSGWVCLVGPRHADAISIDFVPASQTGFANRPVAVDVVISGLGSGAPPSLGAFDLDVAFDASVLTPIGIEFGPLLGNPGLSEALTGFLFSPGVVNVAEVSLLAPSVLDALQPTSFVLASVSFMARSEGTSQLIFVQHILSDAFGRDLPATVGTGKVEVVPEPMSFVLVAIGAGVFCLSPRRRIGGRSVDSSSG